MLHLSYRIRTHELGRFPGVAMIFRSVAFGSRVPTNERVRLLDAELFLFNNNFWGVNCLLFYEDFFCFAALSFDVNAVMRIVNTHAIQIVVFRRLVALV